MALKQFSTGRAVYRIAASSFLAAVIFEIVMIAGLHLLENMTVGLIKASGFLIVILLVVDPVLAVFAFTRKSMTLASITGCGFGLLLVLIRFKLS
jgi:hypothetical protein